MASVIVIGIVIALVSIWKKISIQEVKNKIKTKKMPATSVVAHIVSGGEVLGKWVKVGDVVQSWRTHVVTWSTQWTEQNTKSQWQQCLAINILYIMYIIGIY